MTTTMSEIFPIFAEQETTPIFGWLERLVMRTALADLDRASRSYHGGDSELCLPRLLQRPHCPRGH